MNLKFGIPHQRLSRFAQIHALFPTTIRVVKIPTPLAIAEREIGVEASPFFIAEISANHGGELSSALELVDIAAKAGASAIKIHHYPIHLARISNRRWNFMGRPSVIRLICRSNDSMGMDQGNLSSSLGKWAHLFFFSI
jgi:hypothetical protein